MSPSFTPSAAPVRLRATSLTDLLQLVPYLLGFHPTESVVAVLLHRRRVLLTARVDLGPPMAGLADQLARVTARHRATGVLFAVYSASPVLALVALDGLVDDLRLPRVIDAVHVDAGRWWSLLHGGCLEGELLDRGHLAAEAVFAGLSAEPDRSRAVAAADRPPADRLTALAAPLSRQTDLIASWTPRACRFEAVRLVTAWLADVSSDVSSDPSIDSCREPDVRTEVLSTDELLRLGVLVADSDTRDAVMMLLEAGRAECLVACWSAVVAVLPDEHALAPLCLLGLSAWVGGHGALLVGCVERVEQSDPGYSLGRLLAQIADQAVPPSAWSSVSSGAITADRVLLEGT